MAHITDVAAIKEALGKRPRKYKLRLRVDDLLNDEHMELEGEPSDIEKITTQLQRLEDVLESAGFLSSITLTIISAGRT